MFNDVHKPERGGEEKGKETENIVYINYRPRFQQKESKTFYQIPTIV